VAKASNRVRSAASTAVVPSTGPPIAGKLARKVALRGAEAVARRALRSSIEAIALTLERTAELGADAIGSGGLGRLPIQRAVDVAVPLRVAWEEWMSLSFLPEGAHRVEHIERDCRGRLSGCIVGRGGSCGADWEAEVLDERERQSFAWHSVEGSDCAGLVTFHELSQRLTRIELNLDVVPTGVPEALALSAHLADRRAQADLRRFKAQLELINPDLYEDQPQDGGPNHPDRTAATT
jgi:uncharacterized membrane protein